MSEDGLKRELRKALNSALLSADNKYRAISEVAAELVRHIPATTPQPTAEVAEAYRVLLHDYETTRGLWCIDRDPKEIGIEWVRHNGFQLELDKGLKAAIETLYAAAQSPQRSAELVRKRWTASEEVDFIEGCLKAADGGKGLNELEITAFATIREALSAFGEGGG